MENSTNLTQECFDGAPTAMEFFAGFELIHGLILIVPIVLCMMTYLVYVINLRHTSKHGHKDTKGNVAALMTIYPVSCMRSWVIVSNKCHIDVILILRLLQARHLSRLSYQKLTSSVTRLPTSVLLFYLISSTGNFNDIFALIES